MKGIRWKVVRNNRYSLWISAVSPYGREYKKDSIIESSLISPGLFTFKTKRHAIEYIKEMKLLRVKIIKVRPLDKRGFVPKSISRYIDNTSLHHFNFEVIDNVAKMQPPKGTICYKKVRVLT